MNTNLFPLPTFARIIPEVEDYIATDSVGTGFTLNRPTSGDKFIAWKISKDFGIEVAPWDVVATKRYMLNMGFLVECGLWRRLMTYAVKKEFAG